MLRTQRDLMPQGQHCEVVAQACGLQARFIAVHTRMRREQLCVCSSAALPANNTLTARQHCATCKDTRRNLAACVCVCVQPCTWLRHPAAAGRQCSAHLYQQPSSSRNTSRVARTQQDAAKPLGLAPKIPQKSGHMIPVMTGITRCSQSPTTCVAAISRGPCSRPSAAHHQQGSVRPRGMMHLLSRHPAHQASLQQAHMLLPQALHQATSRVGHEALWPSTGWHPLRCQCHARHVLTTQQRFEKTLKVSTCIDPKPWRVLHPHRLTHTTRLTNTTMRFPHKPRSVRETVQTHQAPHSSGLSNTYHTPRPRNQVPTGSAGIKNQPCAEHAHKKPSPDTPPTQRAPAHDPGSTGAMPHRPTAHASVPKSCRHA
jgi:hypothetical protein